jgi:glycosyltransferase 2 family protein
MVSLRPASAHPLEPYAVIGGAALLAGSWVVVAAAGDVPGWEATLFERINDLPPALWPVVRVPMQLGSFVGSLVIVAGTAIVTRNKRLALAALVGSQAAYWGAKLVKSAVSRARPAELLVGVHLHEPAHGLGYISGHTAVACALAAVLGPELPVRWQIIAGVLAVIVGFARIYAGAHLPLDVIGGAGLGLLTGTLSRWAFGLGGEGMPARHHEPG